MSVPDIKNVVVSDPNDFTYVSIKNWRRKQNVINGNDKLSNLVGRPGPLTGFILGIIDVIVTLAVKFGIKMFTISTIAFNWMYTIIFGNFIGIIPTSITGGTVVSMKFIRYTMTVLMPPFGVLLSKGLYGWFNIIVCMIITYINFFAGIIYAFVITARNRYSDQYEVYSLQKAMDDNNNQTASEFVNDSSALYGTLGFVLLLGLFFFICLSFF
jgi:uncharacterized membrane protein YqaE (UPF0057 family)